MFLQNIIITAGRVSIIRNNQSLTFFSIGGTLTYDKHTTTNRYFDRYYGFDAEVI